MKLEKGKEIVKPTYSDVYKFDLRFMIGDADGYEYEYLYISSKNKYIKTFITFLEACKKAYPHGRGCNDNYDKKVPKWKIFCGDNDLTKEDEELQQFRFDWPYDQYSDRQTTFDRYNITYFDTNNVEYEVNVQI